jgi:nitrous oxidase accessory protein NosD
MRQIAVLFLLLILPAAHAAQWRVVPGESLADVVQRAAPGDEIIVERGVYAGNLQIDKPLTLSGHNRPTLHGGNHGDVIRITAPDVTVQGFIVTHSGDDLEKQNAGIYVYPGSHRALIRNNDIAYSLFGLWIEKANDVRVIENNLITGKRDILSSMRGNGIQLYNTSGARIIGNNISFVRDAIYVDVSATMRCFAATHAPLALWYPLHELLPQRLGGQPDLPQPRRAGADGGAQPDRAQQPGLGQFRPRHHAAHNSGCGGGEQYRRRQQPGFFVYDAEYNTCAAIW